jgi:NAD(P)-dependent dehydrogenase (short-subunit alcohol dehydrogenase family)
MASRPRTRVFVITDAGSPIGSALASQLADFGQRLVLAGTDQAAVQDLANRCIRDGTKAIAVQADVSVEGDCRRLIDRALEAFGRIDVLVNNAGLSMPARFDEISDWAAFDRLWRVNSLATVHCTRFAWPHLKQVLGKRGGQIVGINAPAGRTGLPGRTADSATRFAQAGFLEALRDEAAEHDIAVTIVYPPDLAGAALPEKQNGKDEPAESTGAPVAAEPAIPIDECVRQIIDAIDARQRELVIGGTSSGGFSHWLRRVVFRRGDAPAGNGAHKEGTA